MKKIFLIVTILIVSQSFSFGQGTIRGKVKDENGDAVIGASIVLKSNPTYGVTTDLDGNYSLIIKDSIPQIIVLSFVSYNKIEESVHPINNEVIIRNYFLVPVSQGIKEVEITAKAVKAREYYTEMIKKNSAVTLDYISSETMKKTGDNNIISAIARVTGVTTTNKGFISVRGIGDRYIKTAVNGSAIPTLDPFTNNIKLDIFPSSLVDNIFITKTASPDLPGNWAGAYLSVETKDYPENLTINAETLFGYNNQSTFKNYISSEKSSTDWLGYDNGFREHNHNNFVSANMTPTTYQEFVALGLGDYYKSLGVNSNTPWNDTYYKLGLVELKLLSPAQFNDANAVTQAKNLYESGSYHADAFNKINSEVPNSGKSFPNNWNTVYRKAPLNFSQSFSIGNQIKLFGKPLGFITGFRYGSAISYDPNASANRQASPDGTTITIQNKLIGESSSERNGWNGLASLAYKLNPNNSISFLFMPNFSGVNNVRYSVDYADPVELFLTKDQFYESRKQLIYQYKSEHYIQGPKIKLEFNASYTNGDSKAPDFKTLEYTQDRATGIFGIGQDANRSYRYLSENVLDCRASAEFPIGNSAGLLRKLKFGGSYQNNQRNNEQFDYYIRYGPFANATLGEEGIENFFSHDKFEIHPGIFNGVPYNTIDLYYNRVDNPSNHTIGYSRIKAGFAMFDYSLNKQVRVMGGLRIEQAEIYTDAFKYDSLNLASNDARRQFGGEIITLNPGKLSEINYLPSINLIYKLKDSETSPINLRMNFSQTIALPSIREMTDVAVYDYELRAYVYGNSDLKEVHIDNYDLRIESYFESGDNLSLSFFYKKFKNNIELTDAPLGYTWMNVDDSKVIGIELEGKKVLTKHLEIMANVTLVNSQTNYVQQAILISNGIKTYTPIGEVSRTMFGQSPYVINGILTYSLDKPGIIASVSYNVQGPKLYISSFNKIFEVYDLPRHLLDAKVSKKLGNHFNVSISVRDILNSPERRSYNNEEGWILDYGRLTYGTNFILGISYKL